MKVPSSIVLSLQKIGPKTIIPRHSTTIFTYMYMYVHVQHVRTFDTIPYNRLCMRLRNLCVLTKKGYLWILFMRGSTWGVAILPLI